VPLVFLQNAGEPAAFIKRNRVLHNVWYVCNLGRVPKGKDVVILEDYSQRLNMFMFNLVIGITRRAKLACTTQVFYFGYRRSRLKNFIDKMISRIFFLPVDMVIASSSAMAQDTANVMKVPEHKLKVVYPPIRMEFAGSTMASRSNNGEHPLDLLFVGYLDPRKGIEYLLQALKVLREQHVRLTVVGNESANPSYSRKMHTLVEELGLEEQVSFLGEVKSTENLIELYKKADVFVLPSTYESFGIALV
jgi:glycosyltransferase involved in cell wall biosynthesis